MAGRSRRSRERLLLPGETLGRRRFLQVGALGAALLAVGGWLAWRRPKEASAGAGGPFAVLSPEEAGLLLAISGRVLPAEPPFPSPERVRVVERIDGFLAMSHPGVRRDVKRLLALFDSALAGLALDGAPFRFRGAPPARQDARLAAWSTSRLGVRRSGFRALRRLVGSAYWSSPEIWAAVGYPGPPRLGPRPAPEAPPDALDDRPVAPRGLPGAAPADLHPPLRPTATDSAGGAGG